MMTYEKQCLKCGNVKSIKVRFQEILEAVSFVYDIPVDVLISKTQVRTVTEARFMFCYLMRKIHKHTISNLDIAKIVNKNEHTAVSYSIRVINDWMETDPKVKERHDKIMEILFPK